MIWLARVTCICGSSEDSFASAMDQVVCCQRERLVAVFSNRFTWGKKIKSGGFKIAMLLCTWPLYYVNIRYTRCKSILLHYCLRQLYWHDELLRFSPFMFPFSLKRRALPPKVTSSSFQASRSSKYLKVNQMLCNKLPACHKQQKRVSCIWTFVRCAEHNGINSSLSKHIFF